MAVTFCNGWWEALPPPPPATPVEGSRRVATAIVGAGVTGLACARRLAEREPGAEIALLDSGRVGEGSSGRNSGFVMNVVHHVPNLGDGPNRARYELSRMGTQLLRERVAADGIECGWTEGARLHVAVEPVGERKLAAFREAVLGHGLEPTDLDAAAVADRIGTDYYRAGLEVPGGALVQPAALLRGLGVALPGSIALHEGSPVLGIEPAGGGRHRVLTRDGALLADRVVLAAGAGIPALGRLGSRIVTLVTFASLTRALTAEEADGLGGDPVWGVVPEEPMGTTLRRTPDDRILVRNSVRYGAAGMDEPGTLDRVRRAHREALDARFPALRQVELEHTWGGTLAATLNDTHCFGPVGGGAWVAAAYNGVGLALGTALGTLLADRIVGAENEDLRWTEALPAPFWLPPDPLRGLGVSVYVGFLQRRAGRER